MDVDRSFRRAYCLYHHRGDRVEVHNWLYQDVSLLPLRIYWAKYTYRKWKAATELLASKDVGLELSTWLTCSWLVTTDSAANKFFETEAKSRQLRPSVTEKNSVLQEIKSRLYAGNVSIVQFRFLAFILV